MLERFVAQVLNKYIGQYVENFNTQNLSIGIVQGAVELEGLLLRKDALKEFNIPGIDIKWGYIGNITLQIPSYKDYNEPWVIDINKLYIVVGPCKTDESSTDEDAEAKHKEERKNEQLLELEEKWRATQDTSKSFYAIWRSYSSSIVTSIVENLQVRLFDLHLRYEDNITLPETFACGFHIDALSAQTTDRKWNPKSTTRSAADKRWKRMHLKEMSFYWDTKSTIFGDLSHDELVDMMSKSTRTSTTASNENTSLDGRQNRQFVLSPVSGEARLTRACSLLPLRSKNEPRLTLDVDLPSIPLCLNKSQYCQALALVGEITRWNTRKQHSVGRPNVTILEDANAWWKWAIDKHLQRVSAKRYRRTFVYLCQRIRLITKYARKYEEFLLAKYFTKTHVSDKLTSSLQEMRNQLAIEDLIVLHELVYYKMDEATRKKREAERAKLLKPKSSQKNVSKDKHSHGWHWGWLGKWRNQKPAPASEAVPEESEVTEDKDVDGDDHRVDVEASAAKKDKQSRVGVEMSVFKDLNEEEIFEMFGDELSEEDTTDTFLKRDSVLLRLNFSLHSGTFTLTDYDSSSTDMSAQDGIVSLQFKTVNVASEWRPRYGSHEIKVDLGSIVLRDLNPLNTKFSDLITPSVQLEKSTYQSFVNTADVGEETPPSGPSKTFLPEKWLNVAPSADQNTADVETTHPVFSITYEKLSRNRSGQFSDSLKVVTAPLSVTYFPGITERLKKFFRTPDTAGKTIPSAYVESELLKKAAKQRYDMWMKQAQNEVKNAVRRLMEGKTTTKVGKEKWAVSLSISAPNIIIPEDWTNPKSSVVVLNLGHMTFENHKGDILSPETTSVKEDTLSVPDLHVDEDSDEDDYFITPPITPPSEEDLLAITQRMSIGKAAQQVESAMKQTSDPHLPEKDVETHANVLDHEELTERMIQDKMYERYQLNFTNLKILIASNRRRWDVFKQTGKGLLSLVDEFSVNLLAEKRIVETEDSRYPAFKVTGKLPQLVLLISHTKVHSVLKCMQQFSKKSVSKMEESKNFEINSPLSSPRVDSPSSGRFNIRSSPREVDVSKAESKQVACDFLIRHISMVLEDETKKIISVMEVNSVEIKCLQRPFDSSIFLSIFSLLMVDPVQKFGSNYELLLASHRNLSMDVERGYIVDSGNASPVSMPQAQPSASNPTNVPDLVVHSPSPSQSFHDDMSKMFTSNNNLHDSASNESTFKFPMSVEAVNGSKSSIESGFLQNKSESLITLEIKNLRKGSPHLLAESGSEQDDESPQLQSPGNHVNATFSNLDVICNSGGWVALLDYLHRLIPNGKSAETAQARDPYLVKAKPATTKFSGDLSSSDLEKNSTNTRININFKTLNVLVIRGVVLSDSEVARKVATVTIQGAKVGVAMGSEVADSSDQNFLVRLKASGSIKSLQMQDLTLFHDHSNDSSYGFEVLNVGADEDSIEEPDALAFTFQHGTLHPFLPRESNVTLNFPSAKTASEPVLHGAKTTESFVDSSASESMLFVMENEEAPGATLKPVTRKKSEIFIQLASMYYIHSPRLVAELLAFIDEVGDSIRADMTTATKKAYKDMAKSIIEKMSDFGVSVLGENAAEENNSSDAENENVSTSSKTKVPKSAPSRNPPKLCFDLQIETPIVALPKFPGSYELLVANLGQIRIQNIHDVESGADPFDKLNIKIVNMNLRSHRQREKEVAAKKVSESTELNDKTPVGASITDLKKVSLRFMNDEMTSSTFGQRSDIQILHKTSFQLSIVRKPFVPSGTCLLDVRNCCESTDSDHCSSSASCHYFSSLVGQLSDTRMCIDVEAASALTVTLSKHAYEQLLKTLDNVAYGGDIDDLSGKDKSKPKKTASLPSFSSPNALHETETKEKRKAEPLSHSMSYHSTPRHYKTSTLFDVPGFEIPKKVQRPEPNVPQRKYTPMSAKFSLPCLIFQLNGDLSDGEQGIVKVTLQRFKGSFQKENRFGTAVDLSLGSLDIEDMLQDENSKNRHIVSSSQHTKNIAPPAQITEYLSMSCPAFLETTTVASPVMSASLPSANMPVKQNISSHKRKSPGVFRPYDALYTSDSNPLAASSLRDSPREPKTNKTKRATNDENSTFSPPPPPLEPDPSLATESAGSEESTLVRIKVFLVDGNSDAYLYVYDRVNRRVNVDFNALDCKVNLQTWVVLLDFFGIGTSPKKTYKLDPDVEQTLSWDQRLDVYSFYENQPKGFINSEINFKVRSFNITLNKTEYELLKANVAGLQSHVQIRDGLLSVSGQLGGLSVSDLSPNGSLYSERFVFTGDKALDFQIKKFDEYDHNLQRDYDISVRLRMSSIRYVHTQRFQNETVAFCQHFQQLQEVLGRMRAASVGQSVRASAHRQARVELDIEADTPIILIPESSHSDRLLVANLGHIIVSNQFKKNGSPGTLSYKEKTHCKVGFASDNLDGDRPLIDVEEDYSRLLDVIHVMLIDMDLFTASHSKDSQQTEPSSAAADDSMRLVFPSYTVTCNNRPLLKEKVKLELQMERNLEKEISHQGVPDTSLSARLSSVYCTIDHPQYWLIRGILDHNMGEAIPDFPQPTAFLQPSKLQTVLTGAVYTGLSLDFILENVSIELVSKHARDHLPAKSLVRLDFVKSRLSYQAFSNNIKTTNLSCEAFRAHDTRFNQEPASSSADASVFTTILGANEIRNSQSQTSLSCPTLLHFELFQRVGPGFMEMKALLNNMRVYLIMDWLRDTSNYLITNPNQQRCNTLRAKTAKLMAMYRQVDSGNQSDLDSSGQLKPEIRSNDMKICFTDTEFVLVEDTSRLDSDAIILRSTAVLHYFPDRKGTQESYDSPIPALSCSLQSLEVFSCQLDKENETALSIVDPVTINFDVRAIKQIDISQEEIQANPAILDKNVLDIQVSKLNIRVSYNDIMLFLNILKSLTARSNLKDSDGDSHSLPDSDQQSAPSNRVVVKYQPTPASMERLVELGYSKNDVIHALTINHGSVELAANWLIENATLKVPTKISKQGQAESKRKKVPLDISRVFLHTDVLRVCLIDDCGEDCDVPLAEWAVRSLSIRQALAEDMEESVKELMHGEFGSSTFELSGDYFNRMLSLWEPFLEPWRCNVSWRHERGRTEKMVGKWNVEMHASDRFDLSVTSTLIDTVKKTASTWQKDYAQANSSKSVSLARKREPFVPYLLRNLTGCFLRFATQTAVLHEAEIHAESGGPSSYSSEWIEVIPGEDRSFNFATMHEKQRHKRSDSLKLHQISVQVGEWKTLQPVTISKVGVYFRHAFKIINKSSSVYEPSLPVRVVFHVALEGSAQKVVTVRSALAVRSRVKIPIQVQLQQSKNRQDIFTMPILNPGKTQYIPLALTSCSMRIRPCISSSSMATSYGYSSKSIHWQNATTDYPQESNLLECSPTNNQHQKFYFAMYVKREPYPSYEKVCEMLSHQGGMEFHNDGEWQTCLPQLPGHTIIILPPVVISNLLPCDLHYYIKNKNVEGTLKPGVDATPHAVHVLSDSPSMIVGCLIDGYQSCRELVIPSVVKNFQMRMLIKDTRGETLVLNVRILWRLNCSLRISVMAGYWIVNKTGLPIVVKQEGSTEIAAGQYEAHEQARSLQPLLFSYANPEGTYLCTMRLGKKAQLDNTPFPDSSRFIPSFCQRFSTDGGSCTRSLKLITVDGTPDREFCIGISVQRGWGRYLHTHIVSVAPRFLLINRTASSRLSFAQRHTISYRSDSSGTNYHLSLMPGSSVVFHWPRVDLDTLLCVRLADEPSCLWSGGFFIDQTDAFHVALRLASRSSAITKNLHPLAPHCIFLTVEVTLVEATYRICFGDADPSRVPPPFRVDNVSSAPIVFKQVNTDDSYYTEVPAETQLAYARDEPCLSPTIQCLVRGGSSSVQMDMNVVGEEKLLYYENYIYIAVGSSQQQTASRFNHNREVLVLDVQSNQKMHYITLQPLRSGKRSQLWRMTSEGRVYHEGSSPPEKSLPRASGSSSHMNQRSPGLVLDIAEMAYNVGRSLGQGIPLALRQPDERRRSTQTWHFDSDGRLKCRHRNLSVQVVELVPGSSVILASYDERRVCLLNELCSRHKLIPGSGCLSLKVVRDGPTRALCVVDIRQKRAGVFSKSSEWTILESSEFHSSSSLESNDMTVVSPHKESSKFYVSVNMPKGVGISLVSNTPEELLYITMSGVRIETSTESMEQVFSLRVQKLQIDNQLLDGYPVVMLHPHRSSTSSSATRVLSSSTDPLIFVQAIRQPSSSRIYEIYKSLVVDVGRLSIAIEERLLLKLLHFFGFGLTSPTHDAELLDETKMDTTITLNSFDDHVSTPKRLYFDTLRLSSAPIRLSVITASRLPPELKSVKQALSFSLIQFERAPVAVEPYFKRHLFEALSFVMADFSKHLREQLKGQAAKILGSVDFLGNPIGLLSDVKAGVIHLGQGKVQNMFMRITHGVSDSTAKFTGALSDGIGEITMDEDYEEKRRAIQANARRGTGSHVVAGLHGLMAGVIGGLTSVVTQPVKGAQSDGAAGFFKGLGKGIVGTVAKPVTGVLDLASESASAVREISLSRDDVLTRVRPVRCCHSFQGCLQCYSQSRAEGQVFLYALNQSDFSEHFYSSDKLNSFTQDNVLVIITDKKVYFVNDGEPDIDQIILVVDYSQLVNVSVVVLHQDGTTSSTQGNADSKVFLELAVKSAPNIGSYGYQKNPSTRFQMKKPRVTCHSYTVAQRVCQQIQYAKNLASEHTETMHCDPEEETHDRSFDIEV